LFVLDSRAIAEFQQNIHPDAAGSKPEANLFQGFPSAAGEIVEFPRLGGLLKSYRRVKEPRHDSMEFHGADAEDTFRLGLGFRLD
jgi:hypothetical protein